MNKATEFLSKNKESLFAMARANTVYNKDGKAVIEKDDEWRNETEWDNLYERVVANGTHR